MRKDEEAGDNTLNKRSSLVIETVIIIVFAIVLTASCMTSCSSRQERANEMNAISEPKYEESYSDLTVADVCSNSSDIESLIEYISSKGYELVSDETVAAWQGAAGVTKYSLKDIDGNILSVDGARAAGVGYVILEVNTLVPQDLSAEESLKEVTGVESFEGYKEQEKDFGNMAIGVFADETGNNVYVIGNRIYGNDSPSFVVAAYILGSDKAFVNNLRLQPDASPSSVLETFVNVIGSE